MVDPGISRNAFLDAYVEALDRGHAAVFVGAGVSMPAGFVDWKSLLQDFAEELGLDLDVEQDLVSVAQYHINANANDRSRLNQKIVNEFSKKATPTASHIELANLPVSIFWTSNYDKLLEKCLEESGRRVDVKVGDSALTVTSADAQSTVFKMHGDVGTPASLIITRDDYEFYATEHAGFQTALRAYLSSVTFLFVGLSFSDPNLDYIFGQVRAIFRQNQRTHYAVFKRDTRPENERRQELRITDLKRYGVHVVLVDEYENIPELLKELYARYLRRSVMISGAAANFEPLGQDLLEHLCRQIGHALIKEDYNVVSGFGLGIGGPTILGAIEELYRDPEPDMARRLKLFPFPQEHPEGMTREEFFSRYRQDMLSHAGFVVVVAGNREARNGTRDIEPSSGVREEVEMAKAAGKYIIPIGATGWMAREVWDECARDFESMYPPGTPRDAFDALGDKTKSNDELVEATMKLIRHLTPKA